MSITHKLDWIAAENIEALNQQLAEVVAKINDNLHDLDNIVETSKDGDAEDFLVQQVFS